MKIRLTKINKVSYKIDLDDKNVGVLPKKIIHSVIDDIDSTEITELQAKSIFEEIEKKSWNSLLNFIAIRERSKKECFDYLKRKFVTDSIIEKLLIKAEGYKYVDDERFCRLYAESLFENGKSLNYIQYKLTEKGINETIMTNILRELSSKNEKRLDEIVKKAMKKYELLPENKQFEKTMNYLVRNGFEYYDIKEKVKNMIYGG